MRWASRLRTWWAWVRLRRCYWFEWHPWLPWVRGGWSRAYLGPELVFDGRLEHRHCPRCGAHEHRDVPGGLG